MPQWLEPSFKQLTFGKDKTIPFLKRSRLVFYFHLCRLMLLRRRDALAGPAAPQELGSGAECRWTREGQGDPFPAPRVPGQLSQDVAPGAGPARCRRDAVTAPPQDPGWPEEGAHPVPELESLTRFFPRAHARVQSPYPQQPCSTDPGLLVSPCAFHRPNKQTNE